MSDMTEKRTGFCIKTVDKTDRQIIRIIFWSQVICLVPFLITDLVTIYTNDSPCLYVRLNPNSDVTLGLWLFIDGYAKLLVFFIVCVVTFFDAQTMSKSYLTCLGNLIRFFYLFDLAWTFVASVLFWAKYNIFPPYSQPLYVRTYTYCTPPFTGYIFFLLIFSYIIIPINLYIGSLRPNPQLRGELLTGQTTRRDTQLIEKPKANYK